jgi:hypothetical protein
MGARNRSTTMIVVAQGTLIARKIGTVYQPWAIS